MEKTNKRLVESATPLSQSKLWDIQKNYFANTGIEAFAKEVPFYISSNAFVGMRYAYLIFQMMQDFRRVHQAQDPFIILEMGCGTGQFSFFLQEALHRLIQDTDLKLMYVMSDVAEKNIAYCRENPSFKTYLDNKTLDFAHVSVENIDNVYLQIAQKPLPETKTPLIVICNYVFDCISQDAFACKEGKLYEAQLEIQSRYPDFNVEKSRHLIDLRLKLEYALCQQDRYADDKNKNDILLHYLQRFEKKNATFTMPIGAFHFVDALKKRSQPVFMIVGDKGVTHPHQMSLLQETQSYSYDGCFSFMFNFDALASYVKALEGDAYVSPHYNDFCVAMYTLKMPLNTLPQTFSYFKNQFENCGPHEYCYLYDEVKANSYRYGFKGLLSFLRFSEYDPHALNAIYEKLMTLLPSLSLLQVEDMLNALKSVESKIYATAIGPNAYNMLGTFYFRLNQFEKAKVLFQKAAQIYEKSAVPQRNLGMVYEALKQTTKAISYYQKATELDKRDEFSNRKYHNLSGQFYLKSLLPMVKAGVLLAFISGLVYWIAKFPT